MNLARTSFYLSRFLLSALLVLSSFYCLLAFVPFTYHHLIQLEPVWWLPHFVRLHPYLYSLTFLFVVGSILYRRELAESTASVLILAVFGVFLIAVKPLDNLQLDIASYYWSLGFLAPIVLLATRDIGRTRGEIGWMDPGEGFEGTLFWSALGTAMFIVAVFGVVAFLRSEGVAAGGNLVVLMWALLTHLVAFLLIFLSLVTARHLARFIMGDARGDFFCFALLLSGAIGSIVYWVILSAVSFRGWQAVLYSVVMAGTVAVALVGLAGRTEGESHAMPSDGFDLGFSVLGLPKLGLVGIVPMLIAIGLTAGFATVRLAGMDWNFLFQKLAVIASSFLAFGVVYRSVEARKRSESGTVMFSVVCLLVLSFFWLGRARLASVAEAFGRDRDEVWKVVDDYKAYNASFRLWSDLINRPVGEGDAAFYRFLQRNTNISRAVDIDPVDIDLVDDLSPTKSRKPNIFLFVIDSLRKDYVSVYNSEVFFTPSFSEFSRDSFVFTRPFSHYGATGLSEPSIWVGGLMLHKQYITPFRPMNSLQELLEIEGYEMFVPFETILNVIVADSPAVTRLEPSGRNHDFCAGVEKMEEVIDEYKGSKPIFGYFRPLNLHISSINRERSEEPAGEEYPGFHSPYAWRVRRIDRCFGDFLDYLEKRGLYDSSIIVLTSDHGDSLGEGGRWGHAYTIFPEILEVPLMIRLPGRYRQQYRTDIDEVVFTSDITPSFYYLLGHRPLLRHELFGRPLFTETHQEQRLYRQESFLVASSYGAVYGILAGDGRSLYIADAINFQEYFYELRDGEWESQGPKRIQQERRINRELIRSKIKLLAGYFGFDPGS